MAVLKGITMGSTGSQVLGAFILACLLLFGLVSSAQAAPTITTNASGPVAVGGQVYDTATVTGAASPPGTITFRLYWPGDTGCTHDPPFSSTVAVSGGGGATSQAYVPTVGGTYRWTASYSGDAINATASSPCGTANESVTVSTARPTLTTHSSATVVLGGQISDTATLSGRFKEGGHVPCQVFVSPPFICADSAPPPPGVPFYLYGPDDTMCAGPSVFSSSNLLSASGANEIASSTLLTPTAPSSAPFTPTAVGTYRWIASYLGDEANEPAQGACGAPDESVLVTAPAPDTAKPVLGALAGSLTPNQRHIAASVTASASLISRSCIDAQRLCPPIAKVIRR